MSGCPEPLALIRKYYQPGSLAYEIMVEHGRAVAGKTRDIASSHPELNADMVFIEQAALLHDIGIFMTQAPSLGCHGDKDYICHGYLGRELLEGEGLPSHALVCERHVGVGLTVADIVRYSLPLPMREMLPLTMEEKIICYADKFFSKKKDSPGREKTVEEVRAWIAPYGQEQLQRFEALHELFSR